MAHFVMLDSSKLTPLRNVDERLVSYNIEMTEVTGGTFWKAYTEAQIDGTEEFPVIKCVVKPFALAIGRYDTFDKQFLDRDHYCGIAR